GGSWGNHGFPDVQNIVPTICEKRITVTVSSWETGRLYSRASHSTNSSRRRISGLSCSISRGESSESGLTSTLSITASNTFSRWPSRAPTRTVTIMPLRYLADLSPRRIVAVLRPVRSWSATTGEEKVRAKGGTAARGYRVGTLRER